MRKKLFLTGSLIVLSCVSMAQSLKSSIKKYEESSANIVTQYTDMLKQEVIQRDSLPLQVNTNPYYFRIFAPFTYYYSPANSALKNGSSFDETDEQNTYSVSDGQYGKMDSQVQGAIDEALLYAYLNNPTEVVNSEYNIMKRKEYQEGNIKKAREVKAIEMMKKDEATADNMKEDMVARRPNFWKKSGNASLQFSQNYFSDNWYKGGENTNTMLTALILEANYNDEQKVQWDNKLELKLGFVSSRADSLHKYKTNNDLIRATSKLGVRAVSTFYYTVQAEFNSQFMPGYKSNDKTVYSNFLAPANFIFSVGMDYKKNTKTLTSSVYLSPFAYNFRYVGNDKVNVTQYGIEEGKRQLHVFGSKLEVNTKWTVVKNVTWQSRFYYFTNYEKVESEWENTISLAVNKYLATQLFLHGRFDDGVTRRDGKSYFQLKEFLSVGLSYNF